MVKVRLFRTGAKKRPSYRIVAVDSRKPRQGRVLEFLGTYEPCKGGSIVLRQEALDRWVNKGAQVSDTVSSLLRKQKRGSAEPAESGAAS